MGETKVPYSVVKDMLDMQQKHNEAQLKLLAEHLERCAVMFERALNPPIIPQQDVPDFISQHPRMSEEEEDWLYSYQVGDITKAELDQKLKGHFDGAYDDTIL